MNTLKQTKGNEMKTVMLALSLLLVAGCEEHYRYPCQDPANWNNKECQKPVCEADGTCPDQLTGKEMVKPFWCTDEEHFSFTVC